MRRERRKVGKNENDVMIRAGAPSFFPRLTHHPKNHNALDVLPGEQRRTRKQYYLFAWVPCVD